MDETGKYTQFDVAPHSTHTLVVSLVPAGARVLEFGCATGYMSEVLKSQLGCRVTGIEYSPEAGELARKHCGEQDEWKISLELLHKKTGASSHYREFKSMIRELVENDHLPDYREGHRYRIRDSYKKHLQVRRAFPFAIDGSRL